MWQYRGIRGGGEPPSYLGKYHGSVIVLGGGRCVWDDYAQARSIPHQVMTVNDVGMYYPEPIEHWASEHPKNLIYWHALRKLHALPGPELLHTNKHSADIHVCWDMQNYAPQSGMWAAQVALALGYEQIILCGCPQDGSGHFYDPPWHGPQEHGDPNQRKAFRQIIEHNPELARCTRSMSGWTRELLGAP